MPDPNPPDPVERFPMALDELAATGIGPGELVGVAFAPGTGLAIAGPAATRTLSTGAGAVASAREVEARWGPRWVLWPGGAAALASQGVRLAACWDLAAVHRLGHGGWEAGPGPVWAAAAGLDPAGVPTGPRDLFNQSEPDPHDPQGPFQTDGHLLPDWVAGGWAEDEARLGRWAEAARSAAVRQREALERGPHPARALATARSESAAELLCVELAQDGLPMDRGVAEAIVAGIVGPRPRTEAEAAAQRAARDDDVLRHAPAGGRFDLRNPGQVRSLLRFVGIEVPDTRAWRLEALQEEHPVVEALLRWRKAERVATTYGYRWLDEHLHDDGRLRGAWSSSDGAAGRMTASAGLHNMPAEMRPAVVAEPAHVFVRADLGQIEPRVLAAVSGDASLARATQADDLYAPVARQLGVDRATAKVAVLGALYGQTTGHGAQVLPRLHAAYPVAMGHLDAADRAGQLGQDLRTHGGRLIRMGGPPSGADDRQARARAAARGRYGRNALVQGAAAELFKAWAATVRARSLALDAQIVLCLHDELLVHAPAEHGDATARLLHDCLQEAARRWAPDDSVRFVVDVSVVGRWSDAKG